MAAKRGGGVDGRREEMTAEDVEFLMRRSRWWLEATLNQDFGSTDDFATLIQDGSILQQVAKGLKRMRNEPNVDKSVAFGKREKNAPGGFMNYARASDFTIVCQEFGVNDVELCSSADIVDKRNTRRVCTCIRLLAKNALEQGLDVLDFDEVSGRVWRMPTRKPEDSASATPVERSPVKGVQPALAVTQTTTEPSHANGQEATLTESPPEPAAPPPPETSEPSNVLLPLESEATPLDTSQPEDAPLPAATTTPPETTITHSVATPPELEVTPPDTSHIEDTPLPAVTTPPRETTITQVVATLPEPEMTPEMSQPEVPDSASLPFNEPAPTPSTSGLELHGDELEKALAAAVDDVSIDRVVQDDARSTEPATDKPVSSTQPAMPQEQPLEAASTNSIKEVALPLSGTIQAVEVEAHKEDEPPVGKRKRTGFFFGGFATVIIATVSFGVSAFRAREYIVKRGDCLTWISEERCRTRQWKPLAALNSNVIRNPDLIYPGDRLRLPN